VLRADGEPLAGFLCTHGDDHLVVAAQVSLAWFSGEEVFAACEVTLLAGPASLQRETRAAMGRTRDQGVGRPKSAGVNCWPAWMRFTVTRPLIAEGSSGNAPVTTWLGRTVLAV
jgi:hypothetical protein